LEDLVYFDNLCNALGLDTVSAGTVIAFAMDLFARGLLTPADTGGLRPTWGDAGSMEVLLRQIVTREGLGALLSLGVRRAAEVLGGSAAAYAAHAKGLELSGYHPAHIMGTALGYAVSNRGGDFNSTYASLEYRWSPEQGRRFFGSAQAVDLHAINGKGRLVRLATISSIVLDCLGLCKVPALSLMDDFLLHQAAELAAAYFGKPVSGADLVDIGQSIADMERLFNLRMQPDAGRDTLPQMIFENPDGRLTAAGLQHMRQEFYAAMGWDAGGRVAAAETKKILKPEIEKGA
jgi:aldehyde:ferredoxin oxidoreductase